VLTDLQTLRATTCYIALLSARRYLSDKDFVDFARLAEVLTYRFSSVVGLGTNEVERKYHDAAKLLMENRGAGLREARLILEESMPDAEQFRVAFERLTMGACVTRFKRSRRPLVPSKEKELRGSALVHIEHVMPQVLTDQWKEDLGSDVDQHTEYVNRWGNLTLFFAGLNIPASNKTFAEKQKYYAESQVRLTQDLCSLTSWGPRQIEQRQRWLAEIAERIWRVEPMPAVAGEPAKPTRASEVFRKTLGDLWPVVEPLHVETTAEEIKQLAERLPGHLADHTPNRGFAADLASDLESLLADWETYDSAERPVVRAATAYFLEANDAVPDRADGGLVDDQTVVNAAFAALGRSRNRHPE
jgi:hypothetical protein